MAQGIIQDSVVRNVVDTTWTWGTHTGENTKDILAAIDEILGPTPKSHNKRKEV